MLNAKSHIAVGVLAGWKRVLARRIHWIHQAEISTEIDLANKRQKNHIMRIRKHTTPRECLKNSYIDW